MVKKSIIKKAGILAGCVLSLSALFNTSSLISYFFEDSDNSNTDTADFVQITELKNTIGQSSHIAFVYNEDFNKTREKLGNISAWKEIFLGNNFDIGENIKKRLEKNGFSEEIADDLSHNIADRYHRARGYNPEASAPMYSGAFGQLGPNAFQMDKNGNHIPVVKYALDDMASASPFCLVTYLSSKYSGQTWTNAILDLDGVSKTVFLEKEFGNEFATFITNHELAHCMGANEQKADMIAAMFMLKTHPDPAHAQAFLQHFIDLRFADALFAKAPRDYIQNHLAIADVLQDYQKNGKIALEEDEIWSLAVQKKYYNNDDDISRSGGYLELVIYDIKTEKPELIETMDYKGMALYLAELRDRAPEGQKRDVIGSFQLSLQRISDSLEPMDRRIKPIITASSKSLNKPQSIF